MIACPKCRTIQPVANINTGNLHPCPGCGDPVRADVFNAFTRTADQALATETNPVDGQAECFYHPGKKAVAACDGCGRLLCALCLVEFSGRNLCMRCLQSGRDKQTIKTLQNQRLLNDSIAFHLAFWPMMTVFLTLLSAPAAIFFAVRHWRTPPGLLPKPIVKSIVAFLLATGQLVGWVIFFIVQFGSG